MSHNANTKETFSSPSIKDLKRARRLFENNEPRDLFYRAAIELVELALHKKTSLSITEALAVLLQTWNKSYYQYVKFDRKHFDDIERLVAIYQRHINGLRKREIRGFYDKDRSLIVKIFTDFEKVLGPVGAAKCLHLLAPDFFPIWDRTIAEAYGFYLQKRGTNADRYYRFMIITRKQCEHFDRKRNIQQNPLKAIDEYNYCKYTKEWL